MYMYTFICMYINLKKMYDYMLKHHLQLSRMMNEENVNITIGASGSNNQDGSHHQSHNQYGSHHQDDTLAHVSVF